MDAETPPDTSKLQLAAALIASSVIGAPLVIATAVQTILFTINPRGIDVSHPAAYELEIGLAFALAAAGAVIAVAIVLSRLQQRAETRAVLRVPFMILALQIGFAVVAIALFLMSPGALI
jgi:hypothetical protein